MIAVRTADVRRRSPLYGLLAANAISQTGNVLAFLAIPWFVLQVTGSPAKTGVTVAAGALPVVVAGIFGGVLVDRLGWKRMSILSDLASSVAVLLIPLLYHTTGLAFWQLLVLVVLGALLDAPGVTARRSIYPDLAGSAGISLERANAAYQVVIRSAGLVGPPLAGLLIVAIGASNVLWLNAASFIVSAAIVAVAVPSGFAVTRSNERVERQHYLGDVIEGFRFIRRDPVVLAMTLTFASGSLLAEPLYPVVLPVYAREVYGSALDLGFIFAALAAGSLAGNGLFLAVGPRLPRRRMLISGFAVRALTFWVLVPMPPLGVIVASVIVNALFLEPVNPLGMTILQERVPAGMRGRVFGAMAAIGAGTLPVGMVVYGWLLQAIGLQTTLLILAAVNVALPLAMMLMPGFRRLETVQPRREPAPGARI
jgi:MFS family permease